MRVAHVTSGLGRDAAGVRAVVLGLSRAQQELGLDVAVFGLVNPNSAREMVDWQGLTVKALEVVGPRSVGYAPKMTCALEEYGADLVHLHGLWMHPGRSVMQWHVWTGGKYIVSPHGMLAKPALSYSRIKKRIASAFFQNAVFSRAVGFHATCIQEANEILAYGLDGPIEIFANGIDFIERPRRHETKIKTVLSLGRVTRNKALDQLVLAWCDLEPIFPDWQLVIAGPDENGELGRLKEIVVKRALQRVIFRGPVYGEDKTRLMRNADIFAMPTRSENFALTVAESLMLEVPVVVSKGAPWSGVETEGCGLWVDFGAPHFASALKQMMSVENSIRREMGARGRRWVERDFTWGTIGQQSVQAYKRLLKNA